MPADPNQVKKLFDEAWKLGPKERAEFLDQNCSDSNLRSEVESLLESGSSSGGLLETPILDLPNNFAEGEILAERFKIVRQLGEGGFGIVYEAEDLQTKEHVAIKTLHSHLLLDSRYLARFVREVNLAKKVTHPNVCRIYDLFRHRWPNGNEAVFVSMELLQGETLAKRLERAGKIAPEEAYPLIRQMAEALAASHQANIVHRDLKPENVLLVASPAGALRAVITDFGLAYRLTDERLTMTGAIAGSPLYMSPEQREGREITPASDIYAFGLVVYEMVTGTRPFKAVHEYMRREAPSPRKLVPRIDRPLDAIILKCLQRDPLQRFATAQEIVLALSSASKFHFTPASKKKFRRRLALASALIVLGALAMAGMQMNRPVTLNFDSAATDSEPYEIPAASYLAAAKIDLLQKSPGSEVVIRNVWHAYKGSAIQTSSPPNVLTMGRRAGSTPDAIAFTLGFRKNLCEVDFTRPGLAVATSSGVTHPAWTAHAYDASGAELASASEPLIGSFDFVPAKTYVLRGKGIRSIRFESDYRKRINGELRPFAAFDAVLLDDLALKPCPISALF